MSLPADPDACVHCPHCDYHLATAGEVRAAIHRAGGTLPGGGWAVCENCTNVIHIKADGEHVQPAEGQLDALDKETRRHIARLVFTTKVEKSAERLGLKVEFYETRQRVETVTLEKGVRPVDLGQMRFRGPAGNAAHRQEEKRDTPRYTSGGASIH